MKFDLDEYLSDLETIVNIDSGSNDIKGISRVADFFEEKYKNIDFKVKKHFVGNDSDTGCSLEITNTNLKEYDVLLIGHMDTVFPKGTAAERPFSIKGRRAYGPGVIDMKSGLLLIYYIIKAVESEVTEDPLSICVVLNGDEEIGSKNSRTLIKKKAENSKVSLVFEPGRANGDCVLERKGISGYKLKFIGRAAHAGVEPEKGINAVVELGNWILELDKLNNYEIGTSVSLNLIEGGTASNVIPAEATASLDLRFKSKEERKKVEDKLEELQNNPFVDGIKTEVVHRGMRPVMNPSQKTMRLWERVDKIAQKHGMNINWQATGGGSDANFTANQGVPSIDGLGPAGGEAHSVDEYLELDTIESRFKLAVDLLLSLKGNPL